LALKAFEIEEPAAFRRHWAHAMGLQIYLNSIIVPNRIQKADIASPPAARNIFSQGRSKVCQDPKDKILALYGILRELDIPCPRPDYHQSVERIYTDAAIACIDFDQSLSLLFEAPYEKRYLNLPSWVPDWSVSSYGHNDSRSPLSIERSSELWSWPVEPSWSFSSCRTKLTLKGNIVDTIARKAAVLSVDRRFLKVYAPSEPELSGNVDEVSRSLAESYPSTIGTLKSWFRLSCQRTEYPTGESVGEAFLGTIMGNKDQDIVDSNSVYLDKCNLSLDASITNAICSATKIEDQRGGVYWNYMMLLGNVGGRCFFCTENGYFGTAPDNRVQEGECIALVAHVGIPMVLRPEGRHFRLIAFAAVHGIFGNECWPIPSSNWEDITLV
jgi:hypothetical protein